MSFTANIKDEISKHVMTQAENIACLSAIIRNSAKYSAEDIEISSENSNVTKTIYLFLKDIYKVNAEIITKKITTFKHHNIYILKIKDKVRTILEDLSVIDEKGNYLDMPKEYIASSNDEAKAYLKGAFLSKGSINDPKTSRYHLELVIDQKYEAVFIQRLLNQFLLNSKILMRDNKYMIYIKDSEKIGDFLRIINATNAVLYYENVKIIREQKNMTNRLNNCEQANIDKIIATCNSQIKDIETITSSLGMDLLDEKTKEACIYRLKYPETSLQELSEIMSLETNNSITKSGLNHRFRKIREMAKKIEGSSH